MSHQSGLVAGGSSGSSNNQAGRNIPNASRISMSHQQHVPTPAQHANQHRNIQPTPPGASQLRTTLSSFPNFNRLPTDMKAAPPGQVPNQGPLHHGGQTNHQQIISTYPAPVNLPVNMGLSMPTQAASQRTHYRQAYPTHYVSANPQAYRASPAQICLATGPNYPQHPQYFHQQIQGFSTAYSPVFRPSAQMSPTNMTGPPMAMPQAPQIPPQPIPPVQRENKALAIINPETREQLQVDKPKNTKKTGPPASALSQTMIMATPPVASMFVTAGGPVVPGAVGPVVSMAVSPQVGPSDVKPPGTVAISEPQINHATKREGSSGRQSHSPAPSGLPIVAAVAVPTATDAVQEVPKQTDAPVEAETPAASSVNEVKASGESVGAAKPVKSDDSDEERRKVEERNEENLRKSQEATEREKQKDQVVPAGDQAAPAPAAAAVAPPPPAAVKKEAEEPAAIKAPLTEAKVKSTADVKQAAEVAANKEAPQAAAAAALDSSENATAAKNEEPVQEAPAAAAAEAELEEGELVASDTEEQNETTSGEFGQIYKPGHWSPYHPTGKRQYDRDFLLKLQNRPLSMDPPMGLPDLLEIYKDISHRHTLSDNPQQCRPGGSYGSDNYVGRNGSQRSNATMGRKNNPQGRPDKVKKVITLSSSIHQEVRLHVAEKAWKPIKDAVPTDADEALYKKFRGILNKLTPQRFATLLEQVKSLEINSEDRLSNVTSLVLEKALNETHFASTYARLCHTLLKEFSVTKTNVESGSHASVDFRKMLLQKCQHEFEKDTDDSADSKKREKEQQEMRAQKLEACKTDQERKELQDSFDETDMKAKRRTLGLMRFIGELYNLNILNFHIMHDCFIKLMKNPTDEDSIVCACKLFTTVGKRFAEESAGKTSGDKSKERYNELMAKLKKIIAENRDYQKAGQKHLPQRVIFMLEDVWELKSRNWVPRRDEQAPKTLDQIQQDAENEKIIANIASNSVGGGGNGGRYGSMQGDRNRRGNFGSQSQSSSGANFKQNIKHYFDQVKLPSNSSSPFGTRSTSTAQWVAGASGGGSRNSSLRGNSRSDMDGINMNSANKFALLNQDSSDFPTRSQESSPSRCRDREREKDREAAIQGARNLKPGNANTSRANAGAARGSAPASRTASLSGGAPNHPLNGDGESHSDAVRRYADTIFQEFDTNGNKEELVREFCDRAHKDNVELFVGHFMETAGDSPSKIDRVAEVILELHKERVVSQRNIENALRVQLADAEDLIIDIPKYYDYMAHLISLLMTDLEFKSLLRLCCEVLTKNSNKLLLPLFKRIKENSKDGLASKWLSSGLNLSDLMQGVKEEDFKKVEAVSAAMGATAGGGQFSVQDLTGRFKQAFVIEPIEARNELLTKIIAEIGEEHRKNAVRGCATALLLLGLNRNVSGFDQSYVESLLQHETLQLVEKLFCSPEDISIQALYALQVVNHDLQHPKDVTSNFMNFLYDQDLVSENTILYWGKKNPNHEQVGYHMTVQNASGFLDYLKQDERDGEVRA